MSLFQNNVVKKYTNTLDKKKLDEKWQLFSTIFHNTAKQDNIRNSKEEQYQEGFLRDLFVQILGYTLNPDAHYNLISEQKNETNSKKADGAIILNENVHAVIELKGTETTDLAKIENQAFGYKNNQKNCSYVIISNFEKLRFYIDNATEHIEFNLFTLSRAEFDLLYTCLSLESMQTDLPKKIKNESVSNEDKITKELYKDYSAFRKELFTDIEKLNPQYDRLLLFKKTQKLLDRFLFIFFAEDRQLLPTNLIFSINLEWQKLREARVSVSLYDRYKMYFQDLNTGARVSLPAFGKHTNEIVTAQYDIYAYNGGLFQPDDVLDTIAIDDDLLFKHTKKLSEYDFESEVDVNILGHIFENSLNEIDEITNAIEGQELDKTKTKRKKDGVFYTPKYITKYIVDNTIGKLCEEKKTELALDETKYTIDKRITVATKKKLIETLDSYRKWLLQLTIVDPACGSGAFLNQALEFLIAEHKYVDELQAKLFGDALVLSDVEGSILENNLFGVDLNEESVEIAKLSLWLRTAQRNRKLNSLNNNIKCGNSLVDDATIAGDKAFNWHNEFPQVFEKGGFDVVIGNPPYVLCQQSNTKEDTLEYFKKFEVASYKIDLFHLFFEKSIKYLKNNGKLGFITPNTYLTNKYIQKLRNYILNNTSIEILVNYEDSVFIDAGVDVATIILKKDKKLNNSIETFKSKLGVIESLGNKNQLDWLNDSENNFNIKIEQKFKFKKCLKFEEIGNSYFGIQAYDRKTSISDKKENDQFLPMIDGAEINRYEFSNPNKYFNFVSTNIKSGGDYSVYKKLRIVVRQIGQTPIIGICEPDIVTSNTLYNLYLTDEKYSLKYILAILNSNLIKKYWLSNYSDGKQLFPKIKGYQLKQLPIKIATKNDQQPFIEKADLMLSLNKDLQEISLKFSKYFSGQFKLEKLSGKLEKWYDVSFEEFIKEINKAIKVQKGTPLTKKDEFDWIDLFEENKQKANALQQEIAVTDKAIDAMVYELYGLTQEEIEIVENS
ncbi:TaqI-like C-terminal specificity domain-containing protein [Flavobacterium cheonanense]|uniref:site-specific DNA-methyltransferase (adenine-specific) n=1 Tax=Flavobacterium cheonanense TaxID=706183 RepID=A0ABP7VES0_9FLAO